MTAEVLTSPSRRNFLTATSAIGGALVLGFGVSARGEVRDTLTTDAPFAPNAFLRVDRGGTVTFVMPMIEMGQGTYTSPRSWKSRSTRWRSSIRRRMTRSTSIR